MLKRLHADKWVSAEAVDDLSKAYVFLRRVEHRLQMVADEQTQRLPFERPALAALRQILRLCAARRFRQGPHPSPDHGRTPLRAAVRGRADARRRFGQSRLHRRRRRSGDACDLARARISKAGSRGGDRSRLAFRPARGGPQPAGAGSADGVDAGAAGSLRRIGRRRRRARGLRRGAGAHARQRRAPVDPALQRQPCANCSATCSAAPRGWRR